MNSSVVQTGGATPPASSEARLVVRDLAVSTLGQSPVVAGFSISLEAGKVLGIVGESGSGKSTAALGLLGWARPGLKIVGGTVLVDGTDILSLSATELRSVRGRLVAYVPQDPGSALNPALRLGTQLREALSNHDPDITDAAADERIREVLEEVGLVSSEDFLKRFPHQLSGGQQQRVAIAMAFACRPAVVVLDEPTTGLDVTTQRRVLQTIRELAQEYGSSIVYISHDLAVVAEIADSTAVMYAGRLVESAPTARLFAAPRHRYTAGLLAAIPDADHPVQLLGVGGRPPRPGHWPTGCGFAPRCAAVTDECRVAVPELSGQTPEHVARCIHPVGAGQTTNRPLVAQAGERASEMVLSVSGLSASYHSARVLRNVDIGVVRGQCTAIVGESGSGKTTLARCIVGLHHQWTGSVEFEGMDLAAAGVKRTADQRRRIQYIFQNPYASLNPRMSVGRNIEEPLRFFKKPRRQERERLVCEALDAVALGESYYNRYPDQLSGGERQRVAIARALVVEPDLLVCDEITSALDVSVQAQVVERLRKLQDERGVSILFITHNLAVVRSIATNVAVVAGGRVVESGLVSDVMVEPKHEYTQRLMHDLVRVPDVGMAV